MLSAYAALGTAPNQYVDRLESIGERYQYFTGDVDRLRRAGTTAVSPLAVGTS